MRRARARDVKRPRHRGPVAAVYQRAEITRQLLRVVVEGVHRVVFPRKAAGIVRSFTCRPIGREPDQDDTGAARARPGRRASAEPDEPQPRPDPVAPVDADQYRGPRFELACDARAGVHAGSPRHVRYQCDHLVLGRRSSPHTKTSSSASSAASAHRFSAARWWKAPTTRAGRQALQLLRRAAGRHIEPVGTALVEPERVDAADRDPAVEGLGHADDQLRVAGVPRCDDDDLGRNGGVRVARTGDHCAR
jgi:hypothetical protein